MADTLYEFNAFGCGRVDTRQSGGMRDDHGRGVGR